MLTQAPGLFSIHPFLTKPPSSLELSLANEKRVLDWVTWSVLANGKRVFTCPRNSRVFSHHLGLIRDLPQNGRTSWKLFHLEMNKSAGKSSPRFILLNKVGMENIVPSEAWDWGYFFSTFLRLDSIDCRQGMTVGDITRGSPVFIMGRQDLLIFLAKRLHETRSAAAAVAVSFFNTSNIRLRHFPGLYFMIFLLLTKFHCVMHNNTSHQGLEKDSLFRCLYYRMETFLYLQYQVRIIYFTHHFVLHVYLL